MKKLIVREILTNGQQSPESLMDESAGLEVHRIDTLNWPQLSYRPEVKFLIARSGKYLLLKFFVSEKAVRAVNTKSNQPVYQDSCVEFFIAPDPGGSYLNFEFNAIGVCLSQKGFDRGSRSFLDPDQISLIRTWPSLGRQPFEERYDLPDWSLLVAIPLQILFGPGEIDLHGRSVHANFYKCGDKLSDPHYLSWNPIGTDEPDFHRPEYFGLLEFE